MTADTQNITTPGKSTKETFSVKLGKEKFGLQDFCNYKSMLLLEMLGDLSEQIDIGSIIEVLMGAPREGDTIRLNWIPLAAQILPQALKQAPRVVTRMAGLSLISNKKLAELYDEPNGVAEEISRLAKLIDLSTPGLPLEILTAALPYIGLDALKNGLTGLGGALTQGLTVEEQTPNTG